MNNYIALKGTDGYALILQSEAVRLGLLSQEYIDSLDVVSSLFNDHLVNASLAGLPGFRAFSPYVPTL